MQPSSVSTKTINSDSSETELNIYTNNMPNIPSIEKSIVKWLVDEDLSFQTVPDETDVTINSVIKNKHIKINSVLPNSDIALSIIKSNQQAVSNRPSQDVITHSAPGSTLYNHQIKNTISLNETDSNIIYTASIRFKFENGNNNCEYNGNYLTFDTTDPDYNLHKAINSPYSNTSDNAENGITVSFDNSWNNNNAFYTEHVVERSSNNQLTLGESYSVDGISNNLDYEISNMNENSPLFGSFKINQGEAYVDFNSSYNNTNSNSTMSMTSTDLDNVTNFSININTQQPWSSLNQTQFKELFSNSDLQNIYPGYDFQLTIGEENYGGYTFDNITENEFSSPIYNDNNDIVDYTNGLNLFSLNDNNIDENIKYMLISKSLNAFEYGEQKLYLKNGTFIKNPSQSSIENYNNFMIRDGFETLSVNSPMGLSDLSQSGFFRSYNTNNDINDPEACRYTRYDNYSDHVSGLVVSYDSSESDFISSVGVINNEIKMTPIVETDVHVLVKSTITSDATWTGDGDYEMANDAVLLRQSSSDNLLYDKTNISDFDASGLNDITNSDKFAFLQVFRTLDITDTDNTTLFKTSDDMPINGVISSIGVSNVNFNQILADDLRVVLYGKQVNDLPSISVNPDNSGIDAYWTTSSADGDLQLQSNGLDTNNNDNYLSIAQTPDNPCLINQYFSIIFDNSFTQQINITSLVNASANIDLNQIGNAGKDSMRTTVVTGFSFEYNEDVITENVSNRITGQIDDSSNSPNFRLFNVSTQVVTSDIILAGTGTKYKGVTIDTNNNNYILVKTTQTKTYDLAVRNIIASYNNVWIIFKRVVEKSIWYDLVQISKTSGRNPITDSNIRNLKTAQNTAYPVICSRTFVLPSNDEISTLGATSMYNTKDFLGFTSAVEYHTSSGWLPFELEAHIYDNCIDTTFEATNTIRLKNPINNTSGFGILELNFTINENIIIGDKNHVSTINNTDNKMYIIHLNTPTGSNTLSVVGYTYSILNHSLYLHKDSNWIPYSDNSDNNFLLYDNLGNNIGTVIPNLNIITDRFPETYPIDEVYDKPDIKVSIFSGDTLIVSYITNSRILEDFNIIKIGNPLVQIINRIGDVNSTNYTQVTRDDGLIYVKTTDGMRVNVAYNSERGDFGKFRFLGDILNITPLYDANETSNIYDGRYISPERISIEEVNYPLPTNSNIHKNIYPLMFRGYTNNPSGNYSEIELQRTPAYVKFVISNDYQSDLGDENNVSIIYKNRQLVINDIYSEANEDVNDMSVRTPDNNNVLSIGGIGLSFSTEYSMFPTTISSSKHTIPIIVNCADYVKSISNPNNSPNVTYSSVADVKLHVFDNKTICATRVKVTQSEQIKFSYNVPDIEIYHSPTYVTDARTETNWSLVNTYTDGEIREGLFVGILKFTRTNKFIENYTNYANAPRPSMYVGSYDIKDITHISGDASLPHDLSGLTRKFYYTDIELNSNEYTPFSKTLHGDYDNQENAIGNYGLNNFTISLNTNVNYLMYRYETISPFSFTVPTNTLTIDLAVGETAYNSNYSLYSILEQHYISDILNPNIWNTTTDNNYSSNLWNLKFSLPNGPLSNYINIDPNFYLNKFVYINGVPSFGLGTYYIDVISPNSSQIKLYTFDYDYNYVEDPEPNNEPLIVNFYRYSSADASVNLFSDDKTANFNPIMFTREKIVYSFNISNLLETTEDEPIDLMYRIKESLKTAVNNSSLDWVSDEDYSISRCPVKLSMLDKVGVAKINEMITLTPAEYYKLLLSRRPNIMLINDAIGLPIFRINHDGNVLTKKVYAKSINLMANKPPENYIDQEPSNLAQQFYIDTALGK